MTTAPSLELVVGHPVYRYYVAWTISGDLALELDMRGVTWSRQIRRAGSFSGTMGFNSDEELASAYWGTMPGKMSLYVTRNNVPVWGGIIQRRSYDASTRELVIEATGFESYLYRRTIWHDLVYENTVDQYDVVRSLIAVMQTDFTGLAVESDRATPRPESASIGLTVQTGSSGITQDRQTWQGGQQTSFGDALENFSDNLHGFEYNIEVDWDTEHDKFTKQLVMRQAPPSQLEVDEEYTGERTGLDENFFEFPGNIMTVNYEDNLDDSATRYFAIGKQPESIGSGDTAVQPPPARGVWENEAYFSTQWPVLEMIESSDHQNVSDESLLDEYAENYGRWMHPPIPSWSIVVNGSLNPQPGSFVPGDWCRFVIQDPFLRSSIQLDGDPETKVLTKRIAAFSVTVPDTTQLPEMVALTLIDEWNDDGGS